MHPDKNSPLEISDPPPPSYLYLWTERAIHFHPYANLQIKSYCIKVDADHIDDFLQSAGYIAIKTKFYNFHLTGLWRIFHTMNLDFV